MALFKLVKNKWRNLYYVSQKGYSMPLSKRFTIEGRTFLTAYKDHFHYPFMGVGFKTIAFLREAE